MELVTRLGVPWLFSQDLRHLVRIQTNIHVSFSRHKWWHVIIMLHNLLFSPLHALELCLHHISLRFLLYISSCGKSSSFSLILALEVVISSVCPWEEMSSRSSYSTILATPSIMIYIFFAFLFLVIHSMLDLSSLTRDGTWAPCSGDAEF